MAKSTTTHGSRKKMPPKENDLYRIFFESSGIATIIAGADGTISRANKEFAKLSGYSKKELEGKRKWPDLIVNGDLTKMKQYQEFVSTGAAGALQTHEFKLANRQGVLKDVYASKDPVDGTDFIAISFIDITGIVKARERMKFSEERYRSLIESTDDSIYMFDHDCRYVFVNSQALARFGVSQEAIIGKHYGDFHSIDDTLEFSGYLESVFENATSCRYERMDSKNDRHMLRTLSPIFERENGNIKYVAVVSKDISDLKRTEEKLKYLSLHDPLTNLYNRAYFEEEMRRLDNSRFELVGLIMCDIDGLKLINDTLGHDRGDELLATASGIIRGSFRENDVVARVGGDEFAILLPNTPRSKAEEICKRIKQGVVAYNKKNPLLPLGISTGLAVRTGPGQSMAELYREADNRMYKEKLYSSHRARNVIVKNLINTVEAKGVITKQAVEHLQELAGLLGTAAGLTEKRVKDLLLLAQFHDIGNIAIHEKILLKKGRLSDEDRLEIQKHCDLGHRIAQSAPNLTHVADYILKHHEWWNGSGYPLGLAGEDIPIESRIMAIADAYVSMTGERPHREAMSREAAIEELKKFAGSQFDPDLVEKFIQIVE